jgi:tetratricopeptide (TPR) repeat protein
LIACALCACLAFSTLAHAQSGDTDAQASPKLAADQQRAARSLFGAGTIAFRQLRYEDALENFLQAYRLTNDPVLLFNVGLAYERLYRLPEAQKAFEDYLAALPNAGNRAAVEERIRVVREHIAQTSAPAEEPEEVEAPSPPPPAEEPKPAPVDHRGHRVLPTWAIYTGLGLTAVSGGLTIWSGLDTLSLKDDWEKTHSPKKKDMGQKAELRTNLLIGTTGLFAVATAVVGVFFTDWKGKGKTREAAQTRLAPWLEQGTAGLNLSRSF